MDLSFLTERLGDTAAGAAIGAVVGLVFGFFAQRSRFCLRAATIEVGRWTFGPRLAVWLFVVSVAIVSTHALIAFGVIGTTGIRILNQRGSMSGAIVGGALLGAGMVLARGCPSRLLVLAGQGNLRSALSGMVFAVTAQAAIGGVLSPLRTGLASLWTIEGAALDTSNVMRLGPKGTLAAAFVWAAAAIYFAVRSRISTWAWIGGVGIGFAVMGGWLATYWLSLQSFDPQPLKSVSFSGPSAHFLMTLLSPPGSPIDFDVGLISGVFLGSFLGAWTGGDLKLEGFQGGHATRRYLVGACLMGFGAMLAGGCSVGSVSNAAVFATTAWVALGSMWFAAMLTDALIDWPQERGTTLGQTVSGWLGRGPADAARHLERERS